MYSWHDIASRTERVYNTITQSSRLPLIDRLKRYYGCGAWAGKLFALLVALDYLLLLVLEVWFPAGKVDIARDWPGRDGRRGKKKEEVVNDN
jgi:phosphatidylinositol N-acetylglucosaminyltransferase subunit A